MSEFWLGVAACLGTQLVVTLAALWWAMRRAPVVEGDDLTLGL